MQFGVLSRRQALDVGLSERQIQLRLSAKRWESRLRGVYRIIGALDTAQHSAMACALYAGEGALVSHGSSDVLWRLANVRANDVELWVPSAKTSDVHGLTIHRGKRLDRADRTKLGPMALEDAA